MSKQADISLLIGAVGGYTANGESAKLIQNQLKSQLAGGLSININTKKIVDDIQKALSSKVFNVNVSANGTAKSTNTGNKQQSSTTGTSTAKNAARSFEQEYIALANRIGQAYQAAQNFNSYVAKMSPDQLRLFNKEIQQITQNLNKAVATGNKMSFAEANEQIKALKYNLAQLQTPSSYQQYVEYNNAMRLADQDRWMQNIGLASNVGLEQMNAYYKKLEASSKQAATAQIRDSEKVANSIANAKSQLASFGQYLQRVKPTVLTQYASEIEQINTLLKTAASTGNASALSSATTKIKALKSEMVSMGYEGGNAFTYLHDKIKTFSVYLISSALTMQFIRGMREAIETIYEMDEALTNLRIVMNNSVSEARALLQSYNTMAQELGGTTKSVADAAVEWQRQGFNLEETNTLIKDSMILSITGFIDSSEAATALTAAMKGYQLSVDDALGVVDKFVATDQVAATSAGDLAIALSKTAANAKLAGLSLDEVVGQLAVVNETMQEAPESTGTFYNTMLSRMGMIKAGRLEDPDTGESLSDVETTLSGLGIRLRDSNSEFRNFGDVLDEVGSKWESYNSVQQRAIATAFAGTRQQTRFLSLMSNWKTALEYTEVAANSAGTATEKFGVYQESLEAKTERATAAFEKLSMALLPSGLIGGFLDFATVALNVGSALGGIPITIVGVTTAVLGLSAAFKALAASSFGEAFKSSFASLTSFVPTLSAMGVATQVFSGSQSLASLSTEQLTASIGLLTKAQIAEIAVTEQVDRKILAETLQRAGLERETRKEIFALYELSLAKKTDQAATAGATVSTIGFKNALVGLGTVIKAHPIMFLVTTLLTVIPLLMSFKNVFGNSLDTLKQKYSETETQITELNTELDDTRDKIKELSGYDSLTTVEQSELERLKQYNKYLEDRLYLLKQEQILAANDVNKKIASGDLKDNVDSNWDGYNYSDFIGTREEFYQYSLDSYQGFLESRNNLLEQYSTQYDSMSEKERETLRNSIDYNEQQLEKAKENILELSTYFSDQADALQDVDGDYGEYTEQYEKWMDLAAQGAKILQEFESSNFASGIESVLSQDRFSTIKASLIDLAQQGSLTADAMNDPAYQEFVNALDEAGIISASSKSDLEDLVIVIERLAGVTEDATEETIDLSSQIEAFSNATSKIEKINSLLTDLKENKSGKLTGSFLSELYELLPEVAGQVTSVSDAQAVLTQALEDTKVTAESAYGAMLLSNEKWLTQTINNSNSLQQALAKCYKNDITNWKNNATNKWTVDQTLVNRLSTLWQKYYNMSNEALATDIKSLEALRGQFTSAASSSTNIIMGSVFQAMGNTFDQQLNELKLIQALRENIDFSFEGIDFSPSTTSTTDKATQSIEKYTVAIEEFREALKRLEDVQNAISIEEIKFDMIDEDDVDAQKTAINKLIALYQQEQQALHDLNNERDASIAEIVKELNKYGLGATYDANTNEFWVNNIEKINTISGYKNGVFDQEATNTLRKALEDLIEKAEEYADANIDGSEEWWNIQKKIYDLNQQLYEAEQKVYEQRMEAMKKSYDLLEDLVELEKDRIKQAGEDMIDNLQAEIDAYDEIINRQKELLDLKERERSYEEEVSDAVDEIAKLQAKADALALDDSRSAQLQRAEILEQIAEKQKELDDTQHDYAIENTQDALDEELDMFKDSYQDRIDEIRDFLDDQQKLTDLAYKNIENGGQEAFDKLLEYCLKYTDVSRRELIDMWDNAIAKIKEYGSLSNALHNMSTEIDISENGTPVSVQSKVNEMKANSQKWHTASASERKDLQDRNVELAAEISEILGIPLKLGGDGHWYYGAVGGTRVFHTGGIVGNAPTIKQKEMMILAEKGEMMLNEKQQNNLASLFSVVLGRPDRSNVYNKLIREKEDNQSKIVSIDASVTVQGGMVDDVVLNTITKNQRKVANILNKLVLKK
ncbi:phage tail tape measure protein [Flavonifractor sp. An82]|uniref:phage tail tape measure protein n=1 Tax=Flavonifractor sp. An82 TaxID=1965660 RepID=UPI0013A605CE|nr:phage tail tape measure protein [Flavonifractor sp. An82]